MDNHQTILGAMQGDLVSGCIVGDSELRRLSRALWPDIGRLPDGSFGLYRHNDLRGRVELFHFFHCDTE